MSGERTIGRRSLSSLQALSIAFSVATLLFALPVYDRLYASPGTLELLRLILLVQVGPALGLFLLGELVSGRRASARRFRLFWTVSIVAALLSVVHLAQVKVAPNLLTNLLGQALPLKIGIAAVVLAALLVLVYRGGDALAQRLGSLAPVFVLVCAFFFLKIAVLDAAPGPASLAALSSEESRGDAVFILILDELGRDVLLKDGEVDGTKFPHFRALATESVWFADATTNYSGTCRSIPSLMAGRFAVDRGLSLRDECMDYFLMADETSLLVRLGRRFNVSVYEEYFRDCRSSSRYRCRGIPYLIASYPQISLIDHLVPEAVRKGVVADWLGEPIHRHSAALFREFLAGITSAEARGRVSFLHSVWPHFPYAYDARGRYHHSPYRQFRGAPEHDALVYANYEQQAMLVDSLVGQFVARLKAEGLYDEATIVITSDHGPHGLAADSPFVRGLDPTGSTNLSANVPLLIRSPRLPPQVSRVGYQHVDFLPTVLDLLGIEPVGETEGVSAFAAGRPVREKRFISGSQTYVYRAEERRWVVEATGGGR